MVQLSVMNSPNSVVCEIDIPDCEDQVLSLEVLNLKKLRCAGQDVPVENFVGEIGYHSFPHGALILKNSGSHPR